MAAHMNKQTVAAVVRFVMTCATIGEKAGRCRHPRCKGSLLCTFHKNMEDEGAVLAVTTRANIILLKRKISLARANKMMNKDSRGKKLTEILRELDLLDKKLAGPLDLNKEMRAEKRLAIIASIMEVEILEQEGQDPELKFAAALAEAEKLGRDASAYSNDEEGDDKTKKGRTDSGTSVINGTDGAKKITVMKAVLDMLALGYEITGIHLEPTNNEHMRMLIVAFTLRHEKVPAMCTPEKTPKLWGVIEAIFTGVFDMWVYSNPPKKNRIILDTINIGWSHAQKTPEDPVVVSNGDLRFTDKPGAYRVDVAKSIA